MRTSEILEVVLKGNHLKLLFTVYYKHNIFLVKIEVYVLCTAVIKLDTLTLKVYFSNFFKAFQESLIFNLCLRECLPLFI